MTIRLRELPILVVDCQATASHPGKGHLLEAAWSETSAARDTCKVEARLAKLPEGESVPAAVSRVTGLSVTDAEKGRAPREIYGELVDAAEWVARKGGSRRSPTVVHFASFEERYLRALRDRARWDGERDRFPFLFLCTHEIGKRLLPSLPRHGLRAVAGYFGQPVGELRRAAVHVTATAAVWRRLVALLEEGPGVSDLDGLVEWLRSPRPTRSTRRSFPMPAELLQNLPREPGVYRMLRENGDVLYVGKARVLRDRVRSYFGARTAQREPILEMLSQARNLSLAPTASALEAALLEVDEIGRLSPPYNREFRSRERKLVFASRDFARLADAPDEDHSVGPLPNASAWFAAFSALGNRLRGREDRFPEALVRAEPDTIDAGLELFRKKLGGTALLAHGAREFLRKPEPETEELKLELQYDVGVHRRGSAESVCETLDEIARRISHLVRRAHWLSTLSESTLVWRGRDSERRALVLEAGTVRERLELTEGAPAPEPPGQGAPFVERRKRIDLAAYDRLCVLTREMRRIATEGRGIELLLGRGIRLDEKKLARLLRWV